MAVLRVACVYKKASGKRMLEVSGRKQEAKLGRERERERERERGGERNGITCKGVFCYGFSAPLTVLIKVSFRASS